MHTPKTHRIMTKALAFTAMALFIAGGSRAQDALVRRADQYYASLSFTQAAWMYERASEKGAVDALVAHKLADSYWRVRDLRSAEKWFARAAALPGANSDDVYRYSEALRSNGKFSEADQALARFKSMQGADSRIERQKNATTYVKELSERSFLGATVKGLAVNTEHCDMGASFLGDMVTFSSANRVSASEKRNHTWNSAPFLDLYIAKPDANGELTEVASMGTPFNTKYHDSNTSSNAAGQEIWYTHNNFENGKRRRDEKGVTGLKIFSSTRVGSGPWSDEVPFTFNSDTYSVGHPALSHDAKRMYFASNKPGGRGGNDIWFCERGADGKWSEPVNAGATVNTEGNEMFPFAALDGLLFFSSDGHKGLGGLDVMMASVNGANFTNARNLGAPVNSSGDDFSFVLRSDGLAGYLSSDRAGGRGNDDIYSISLAKKPGLEQKVKGVARNGATNLPMAGVLVEMNGPNGTLAGSATTLADGSFSFPLEPGMRYAIKGDKPDHTDATADIDPLPETDTTVVNDLVLFERRAIVLMINVVDARSGLPLKGVDAQTIDVLTSKVVMEGLTDDNGDFRSTLPDRTIEDMLDLRIRLAREGYLTKKSAYKAPIMEFGEVRLHELLDLRMQPVELGADLGKLINVNPIYFDLGKHNIRKDAALELDKIVEAMEASPNMVIELGSHTDCRSSKAFNEALSDRRAKSSAAYIVSKGIAKDRVTGKGYGESKLVTDCPCEGAVKSKCSEEDHQLNRRTEFIILKM